jgi:hypothetical protein
MCASWVPRSGSETGPLPSISPQDRLAAGLQRRAL